MELPDRADLAGTDLSGWDMASAILATAMFTGANLADANLCRAILVNADLTGADLRGARLVKADLTHINAQGAQYHRSRPTTNLDIRRQPERARLDQALLRRTALIDSDLRAATFRMARFEEPSLTRSTLGPTIATAATGAIMFSETNYLDIDGTTQEATPLQMADWFHPAGSTKSRSSHLPRRRNSGPIGEGSAHLYILVPEIREARLPLASNA